MMKTRLTKTIFRRRVKERAKSELRILKARIRYATRKNHHDALKYRTTELHGCRTCWRDLMQQKTKVRNKEAQMDKAREALEEKLQKHRALIDSFCKLYTVGPNDKGTYHYAGALTKREKEERSLLIRDYGVVTLEGYKLQHSHFETVTGELELNEN